MTAMLLPTSTPALAPTGTIIELAGVTKSFGPITAVRDVDLIVSA